jgi:phosphatidylinositol alpha-1,6-mannosyltransferase
VRALTTRYSSNVNEAQRQQEFDSLSHGALRIVRKSVPFETINLFDLRCLKKFYAEVRKVSRLADSKITCLHCLRAFPEGFVGLLFKKMRPKTVNLVTYAHGEETLIAQTSRQLKWIAKLVYANSDLIVANSKNTKRLVRKMCPKAKVACIHPGVDTAVFAQPREIIEAYKSRLGFSPESLVISTVARMEPRKNHAMVIRAVGELVRKGMPVGYLCCGDGQEKEKLVALAKEQKLEKLVRFTGAVTEQEKRLIYSVSDVYAMPSIQVGEMIEGFGIVFLEAAAAGVPSICGSIGGQPEAVQNGKTGFVVDGLSLIDVCQSIEKLLKNKDIRMEMGKLCKNWAEEHDWSRVSERIQSEIQRVREKSA